MTFRQYTSVFLFLFISVVSHAQEPTLAELVDRAFKTFEPVGLSVAVVESEGIVFKKALGYKNATEKTPLDTRSLFSIASCSKAFTAASVSMLVESNGLNWDDKVIKHIPELRLKDPYVTRQLDMTDILCHRSGFATFDGDLLWYGTNYTDEEIIAHMEHLEIPQGFRRDYGYQNLMFMLAGKVVERVSGKTWSDFVQERIFTPLEMNDTRPSNDELTADDNVTDGHIHGEPIPRYDFNGVKPAASMYSNVEDLAKWTQCLLNDGMLNDQRILSEGSVQNMFTPRTLLNVSRFKRDQGTHFSAYGLGWYLSDYKGVMVIEHSGGMPGYISKVCIVPELDLAFISLNNGEDPVVNDAVKYTVIDQYLRRNGKTAPEFDWIEYYSQRLKAYRLWQKGQEEARVNARVEGTRPSAAIETLTGTYHDPTYGNALVSLDGGKLHLKLEPAANTLYGEMNHWHHDTYRIDFPDKFLPFALVTFYFDEKHQVSGFKIDCPIPDFHFYKLDFEKAP